MSTEPNEQASYRNIFEHAVEGIFQTTPDGRFIRANPALARMLGYATPDELIRTLTNIGHQLYVDPQRRLDFMRLLAEQGQVSGFLSQVYRKDGQTIWQSVSARAVRDEAGRLLYYEGTVEDITDRIRAYQTLEQRVEERTQEIERQRRELEALYQADGYLHQHLRLEQVLEALVDVAKTIFQADKTGVMVWDEQRGRIEVRAARGFSLESLAQMSYRPGEGVAGRVFLTGEMLAIENFQRDSSIARTIADREGIRAMLSVPITIGPEVFGVFGLNYLAPRQFTDNEKRLFLALAQRAGLAIQNARLYEQAQQAAILEERQRLARELHDSVTQALYSQTLLAEAGRRLARAGDWERVENFLARLGDTAQQALKEMRLLVYELRPLAVERDGLVGALQHRLDAVEKRAGVKARVRVDGEFELPGAVEGELFRIACEALNNALKHAGASSVTVTLFADEGQLVMEIEDNGRGFVVGEAVDDGGVGLSSMRERVERLGGSLHIIAAPGQGTRIRTLLPERRTV